MHIEQTVLCIAADELHVIKTGAVELLSFCCVNIVVTVFFTFNYGVPVFTTKSCRVCT